MLKNTPPELPEEPAVPREENEISIGELAIRLEMSQRTIRYYEEIGLVPPAGRTAAGYRTYDAADVHTLRFVRRARPWWQAAQA